MNSIKPNIFEILDTWNPTRVGPILFVILVIGVLLYGANS